MVSIWINLKIKLRNVWFWYWRTRADIPEVAIWVGFFMVFCPAVLHYAQYHAWAFAVLMPCMLVLVVRVIRQFLLK